jgi:hypothetical protein
MEPTAAIRYLVPLLLLAAAVVVERITILEAMVVLEVAVMALA